MLKERFSLIILIAVACAGLWLYPSSSVLADDFIPWPTGSIVILPDIPLVHSDTGFKRLEMAAFIDEASRLMVPLRFLAEELGANVNYAPPYIHVNLNDVGMSLELDSYTVMMGGAAHTMDTVPVIKDGRVFVPLRILCESLGLPIQYRDGVALVGSWFAEPTPEQAAAWKSGILNGLIAFKPGATVEVTVDSRYWVNCLDLLRTNIPLFSYLGDIYAPLQGIMEAKPQEYRWDEATQRAIITHISVITPEVSEIAERWAYPSLGRGSYRAEYVYPVSYDAETNVLVCQGEVLYSFPLISEHQNRYHEFSAPELDNLISMVNEAIVSGNVLKAISYYPWPLVAGGPSSEASPEALAAWKDYMTEIHAPVLIELSLPYSYTDTAVVRPITISYPDYEGGVTLLELNALEFDGTLYVNINELDSHIRWFGFGSCDRP